VDQGHRQPTVNRQRPRCRTAARGNADATNPRSTAKRNRRRGTAAPKIRPSRPVFPDGPGRDSWPGSSLPPPGPPRSLELPRISGNPCGLRVSRFHVERCGRYRSSPLAAARQGRQLEPGWERSSGAPAARPAGKWRIRPARMVRLAVSSGPQRSAPGSGRSPASRLGARCLARHRPTTGRTWRSALICWRLGRCAGAGVELTALITFRR
jgi:hypothetical protein